MMGPSLLRSILVKIQTVREETEGLVWGAVSPVASACHVRAGNDGISGVFQGGSFWRLEDEYWWEDAGGVRTSHPSAV